MRLFQDRLGSRAALALGFAASLLLASPAFAQSSELNDITLDVDIQRGESKPIKWLLGKWGVKLGHTIVVDPKLEGQAIKFLTIDNRNLTWKVFKRILDMNGVIVLEEEVSPGRYLIRIEGGGRNLQTEIAPPFPAYLNQGEAIPDRDEIITAIIQVKHGAARDIFQAVRAIQAKDRRRIGNTQWVRGPEILIVVDLAPTVRFIEKLVRALDNPSPAQSISIRKLKWSVASELAATLQSVIQPQGGAGGPRPVAAPAPAAPGQPRAVAGPATETPQALIIAHDPTNQIIIRAFDYQRAEIDQLVTELDIRVRETGPKFHVYKCQDANAEELAAKLQELITGQKIDLPDRAERRNRTQSTRTGSLSTLGGGLSTGGFAGGGLGGSSFGGNGLGGLGGLSSGPPGSGLSTSVAPRSGGLLGGRSGLGSSNLGSNRNTTTPGRARGNPVGNNAMDAQLIADNRTNSILVQALEEDYIIILQLLRQLDRKKRRVIIEAEVWEISAMDNLLITTELASYDQAAQDSERVLAVSSFGASQVSQNGQRFSRGPGSLSVNAQGQPTIQLAQGLTAFVTKDQIDKIPILLSTLAAYSKSQMVTRPFTMTNDNETASFVVANRVPFSTTTINNVASQQNVQFVDATSSLTVTPIVNNDASLTVEVQLTIAAFGTPPSPMLPPPTNSREYQGTVTVPNGRYVTFGGLDLRTSSITESKIPLLGDIPLLGYLFKSYNAMETYTKLYVFVRPTIFASTQLRQDVEATTALLKKMHVESEEETWMPSIIPGSIRRDDSELQDKVFEVFGTGSGNPFAGSKKD